MPLGDVFFDLNKKITNNSIPPLRHGLQPKTSQIMLFSTPLLSGSYNVSGGTHATISLTRKIIYITFTYYLTQMHETSGFALQLKRFLTNRSRPVAQGCTPQITSNAASWLALIINRNNEYFHSTLYATDYRSNFTDNEILKPCFIRSYDVWGGTHATIPLKTKENLHHIQFWPHTDARNKGLCSEGKETFFLTDGSRPVAQECPLQITSKR